MPCGAAGTSRAAYEGASWALYKPKPLAGAFDEVGTDVVAYDVGAGVVYDVGADVVYAELAGAMYDVAGAGVSYDVAGADDSYAAGADDSYDDTGADGS